MELKFTVTVRENNFVLRDFLPLRAVSSTLARSVKRAGGFFINGEPAHTDRRVKAGDIITFALPPEPPTAVLPQNLPLTIAYENAHAMVLQKPAGQTVHPTRGYISDTLANAFCGTMEQRGVSVLFRPINRLDRGTSGLVLCAMNAWAAPLLSESVQKAYYALVPGSLPDEGVIDAPIALAPDSLIKRCVSPQGKQSCTTYQTLLRADGMSLVRCVLLTGRTHQIRVHFASMGYPLLGDDLYGGDTSLLQRPALHCGQISFICPKEQTRVIVRAPLPSDLKIALEHSDKKLEDNWLFDEKTAAQEL